MNLSPKKRSELRMMFGGKCAYCGCDLPEKGWHADHVKSVQRKMKYVADNRGYGKLIPTGEYYAPENDTEDNLFPCCAPCNIYKGMDTLEIWRKRVLQRVVGVLQRNYPTYRHAVRFGQVRETPGPVVFWFEKYTAQ